jgi:hypothetical protein
VAGKRQDPVGAGRPAGEELGSVEPQRGGRQGLAPKSPVLSNNTDRVCKPGLLATGTRVTVPKVAVNLGVKFLDFASVERCLVIDLDSRYDLILGMAWLERHEPWIDWRSKTLGAARLSPGGALASHEPTSARKQKRYWRGHCTESVNVLDMGVSELMDTGVEDASPEHCSRADRGVARNPLSETHRDESSLNAVHGMVDNQSRHLGLGPSNARGAARNPLSGAASIAAHHRLSLSNKR